MSLNEKWVITYDQPRRKNAMVSRGVYVSKDFHKTIESYKRFDYSKISISSPNDYFDPSKLIQGEIMQLHEQLRKAADLEEIFSLANKLHSELNTLTIAERLQDLLSDIDSNDTQPHIENKKLRESLAKFLALYAYMNLQAFDDFVLTDDLVIQSYWQDRDGKLVLKLSPIVELAYLENSPDLDRTLLSMKVSFSKLVKFLKKDMFTERFFQKYASGYIQ